VVAKGAWLNRCPPVVVRRRPPTNEHDVRVAAVNAIKAISWRRSESAYGLDDDRKAIVEITQQVT
jgi:hypothetical protein